VTIFVKLQIKKSIVIWIITEKINYL
jgi:hypothetical protein